MTQGWLRVAPALDRKRSTEWQPFHPHLTDEPSTPGALYEVDVETWANPHRRAAGLPAGSVRPGQGLGIA